MREGPPYVDNSFGMKAASALEDVVRDRRKGSGQELPDPDFSYLDFADPDEEAAAVRGMELLHGINGHAGADIRRIARRGQTPESAYVERLSEWSEALASGSQPPAEALARQMPEGLAGLSPVRLYERIAFLERFPDTDRADVSSAMQKAAADALGIESEKWIDLVDPLFGVPGAAAKVLDALGFIPEEILTKKKFKSIAPEKIIGAINGLRSLEGSGGGREALRERARLINHFLASRRAEPLRPRDGSGIALDANGLLINVGGLHSHLPYGLIDEETVTELERGNWLDAESVQELRIRKADANSMHSEEKVMQGKGSRS